MIMYLFYVIFVLRIVKIFYQFNSGLHRQCVIVRYGQANSLHFSLTDPSLGSEGEMIRTIR